MSLRAFLLTGLAVYLIATASCSPETPKNLNEEHLRDRIALAWSYFLKGDFESYVSMTSKRHRKSFRGSEQDRKKGSQMLESILRAKPTFELAELQITGRRAKVKVRYSTLEDGGSRFTQIQYDYWVFENGDWFVDDSGRTE